MKINFHFLLVFLLILSISNILISQIIPPAGGGAYHFEKSQCISDDQRKEFVRQINDNKNKYNLAAPIKNLHKNNSIVSFIWPVVVDQKSPFFHSEAITNYVDQNTASSGSQYGATNLDYNCGNRSYDLTTGVDYTNSPGYDHAGVDIATWPFPWYLYEQDLVTVVAAADGVILNKTDGNSDQNCDCSSTITNAIFLEHADGSITWYAHLKLNGLTSKSVGETVQAGEFLGYVASSGCSSAPHLHFEVYDQNNNLIDPYAGPCNSLNTQSWWQNQPNYINSRVNAIKTHSAIPVMACPVVNEVPNFSDCFQPGESIYLAFYYRDQLNGSVSNMRLLRPNQTLYNAWSFTSDNYYSASWYHYIWNLPSNGPFGVWTAEVDYQGVTYKHQFHYEEVNYSGILPINGIQSSSRVVETDGFIQSIQTITAPAVVDYDAGIHVELIPFFEVQLGAAFHAYINGCD